MRAQCSICHELFENDDSQVISAISCGHTFHSHCLNQWLENGRTCPSCRVQVDKRKIIERLFFDAPEDLDEVIDEGKLQNEIDRLKLEVKKKEKEKKDIIKEQEKQSERISELIASQDRIGRLLKEEQTKTSSQLKTLKYYESQQKSLELERQECKKIKQKLVTLQSLEVLLNGTESDAAEVISVAGDGNGAVQTLSRQVAFLKREYEKVKLEKRQIKEHYEKIQLSDMSKNKKVAELTKQCQVLQDQLERSEGDLKISEKEVEMLKRKNNKLRERLKNTSPTGSASSKSSSFTNLMDESLRLQAFSASTPKLGEPSASQNIDLDVTPDLFASPVRSTQAFTAEKMSKEDSESNASGSIKSQKRPLDTEDSENQDEVKYLRITSAAEKNSQKMKRFKSESAIKDTNSISSLASMNIFRKRELGERSTNKPSIVQKGFDGFGGHTTFINPVGNPFKKPVVKKKSTKSGKTVSLPKLDGFIVIDD